MTDNGNDAAENYVHTIAQHFTSSAQASGIMVASNQAEQMEVGLRSKRANDSSCPNFWQMPGRSKRRLETTPGGDAVPLHSKVA